MNPQIKIPEYATCHPIFMSINKRKKNPFMMHYIDGSIVLINRQGIQDYVGSMLVGGVGLVLVFTFLTCTCISINFYSSRLDRYCMSLSYVHIM